MSFRLEDIPGMRITVMGLGLHGGGAASASFFASHGAEVTVTDLRSEEELVSSIELLKDHPVRYVLGRHEELDFQTADIVIKNPGVPGDSPLLQTARRVESDISIFLRLTDAPIFAVTGTKGKSTTVSALKYIMMEKYSKVKLGGNITVSPLTFIDELLEVKGLLSPVILELSSWQLADLRGKSLLSPRFSCITNILRDHQNRYARFEDYIDDKKEIYRGQGDTDTAVFLFDDYGKQFASECKGNVFFFSPSALPASVAGGWLTPEGTGVFSTGGTPIELIPEKIELPGRHNRCNLLVAGIMAYQYGIDADCIRRRAASFPGIPHRLEYAGTVSGLRFYNDSAATIPDAVVEAVNSFPDKCVLITGGTDKQLDFSPYLSIIDIPEAIVLLSGSGTEKIISLLREKGINFSGPYDEMDRACKKACECAPAGGVVLFSPGCASFEFFRNEFHRGDTFKRSVKNCI